MSNNRIIKLTI